MGRCDESDKIQDKRGDEENCTEDANEEMKSKPEVKMKGNSFAPERRNVLMEEKIVNDFSISDDTGIPMNTTDYASMYRSQHEQLGFYHCNNSTIQHEHFFTTQNTDNSYQAYSNLESADMYQYSNVRAPANHVFDNKDSSFSR